MEVDVPSAESYLEEFLPGHGLMTAHLDEIEDYVDDVLESLSEGVQIDGVPPSARKALEELVGQGYRGYVRAYCAIAGHRTAIVLRDDEGLVVFDVRPEEARRAAEEMVRYTDLIEAAINVASAEDLERLRECRELDLVDRDECIAKAREVLAGRRAA